MIRRDYLLRMIEEFMQVLSRIHSLKRGELWRESSEAIEQEFARLLGGGASAVIHLSETELLARIIKEGPTHAVRDKTLMLVTLLKEAGDLSFVQSRAEEGRALHTKALNLLLDTLARYEPFECPEFVPHIAVLVNGLQDTPLPMETQVRLMQHYERIGEFASAENCLFTMLEEASDNPGLKEFGISFYHRLQNQSDDALAAGNLPRAELAAGLEEFCNRTDSQDGGFER
jgi:hypothetical protein